MTQSASEQAWTIGKLLEWTTKHLAQKACGSPRLDADVLLAHVLDCQRIDLYGMRHNEIAGEDIKKQYRELIRQRLDGCPVAYLVGHKEFFSLDFLVTPDVLIPRPDSEIVVMECLKRLKEMNSARVLDLGTGSGNLAITIAKRAPSAEVTSVDISEKALDVANLNTAKHDVDVRFLHGDLFSPLDKGETFDIIISNPPYIPNADISSLSVDVRDYEPHLALDGGPDGFAVFDRIITDASTYLKDGGILLLEIGSPQEEPARARISRLAQYELAPTLFDFARQPRALLATYHACTRELP